MQTFKQILKLNRKNTFKFLNSQKNYTLQNKQQYQFLDFLKDKKFQERMAEKKQQREKMFSKKEEAREEFLEKEEKEYSEVFKEKQQQNPDEYLDKEAFIQSMRKERHAYEAEREKSKQAWAELDQRMIREQQVKAAKIDYNKLMTQNFNVIPVDTFKHPDQLFYFIQNLPDVISEENIVKCLQGFISLSEQMESEALESNLYYEFVSRVQDNINIIANEETYVTISQFGDLYCIDSPYFWEQLERKFIQKLNNLSVNTIVQVLASFSNQKEGSEYFYQQVSQIIAHHIDQPEEHKTLPTFKEYVSVAQSYFRMKAGTLDFFEKVQNAIKQDIQNGDLEEIIKLALIFKNIKKHKEEMFQLLEDRTLQIIEEQGDTIRYELICLAGDGFGFELGSDELFNKLSNMVISDLENCEKKEDLEIFIKGFLFSYRGNPQLLEILKNKIENIVNQQTAYATTNKANKEEMDSLQDNFYSVSELAKIHRAFYIAEFTDKKFDFIVENYIVSQVKDVSRITIDELADCVKAYTITRQGSRQIYKLLEIVIKHRFQDIKLNHKKAEEIYVYYAKSGLCSPELLEQLELIM